MPKYKKEVNFNHNADTLSGSSGAPVFSTIEDRVVGIHYNGYYEGQNRDLGRGVVNSAMKMNLIIEDIREKFPEIIHEISID
jgi:V8-like Glu-specific endopeptidase